MPGTTPVYGFPYPEPTDLVADYPALGQQLAEDIEDVLPTIGGLAPATPTSIANSGGSASLSGNTVTFTGVSSVSLNGCFTGDYDNYALIVGGAGSTTLNFTLRLRVSGTDSSANYDFQRMNINNTTVTGARSTGQAQWILGETGTDRQGFQAQLFGPAIAVQTVATFDNVRRSGGLAIEKWAATHAVSTAYDGFSLIASTGNMTGTVSVYGFKK